MNTQPKLISNATKAKSLVAAVTIAVGLQGVLLWQLNEVANSGAQNATPVVRAPDPAPLTVPAQATLTPICQFTLEPVTIVARRESTASELRVASVKKQAASSAIDRATNDI